MSGDGSTGFIKFDYPAGQYEAFFPGAFDAMIGAEFPVRDERDGATVTGKLHEAVVAPDGRKVQFTIEVPANWISDRPASWEKPHWTVG